MTISNKISVNMSGGEVAPEVRAREDLPLSKKVVARMQNFIAHPQGTARFRSGMKYVHHTRLHNAARFIEFQFSDTQSYLIEATEGYFRFYKDEAIIVESDVTISGATQANPVVVTATGHGYSNGDEVFIQDVEGMTELNGKSYIVANKTNNTFELTDVFGSNIDGTGFTAYSANGVGQKVYEIKTPYIEADLEQLQYAQNADTMYITHKNYDVRRLTRTGHTSWTIERYARTNNPLVVNDATTTGDITAITAANPGVFSDASHTFVVDQWVYVEQIEGMVELNDQWYQINTVAAGSFTLKDPVSGTAIDTSGYTAYTGNGIAQPVEAIGHADNPAGASIHTGTYAGAVTFTDDARLGLMGSIDNPETMYYSRGPSAAGAVRFDDYTTGSGDSDAVIFTLAPLKGKVDAIRWAFNTDKFILVGTFGSARRVFGATEQEPITATAITAKSANSEGVAPTSPVSDGATTFYIQRGRQRLEAIEFNIEIDGYAPDDKNLVADHLTVGGLKQVVRQVGKPNLIWVVRLDGVLIALTFSARENISGWHRHLIASATVEWLGVMPRESNQDQLWAISKRTVNGNTVRHIEFMEDPPDFPDPDDYFVYDDEANTRAAREEDKTEQLGKYHNYLWEVAKDSIHVDSFLTYDGSAAGLAAGATLTVGVGGDVADTEDVVMTASAAVFTSDMVGRELWGKYDSDGNGGGRGTITEFTSSTSVKVTIDAVFPAGNIFAAGDWFLTAATFDGLDHLEGETVTIIADGGTPTTETVTNGSVTTDAQASKAHIGLGYLGIIKTVPLDQGGVTGPAMTKNKNLQSIGVQFIHSGQCRIGTSLYGLIDAQPAGPVKIGRARPLYTGLLNQLYVDNWEEFKSFYLVQPYALPCHVRALDFYMDTADSQ